MVKLRSLVRKYCRLSEVTKAFLVLLLLCTTTLPQQNERVAQSLAKQKAAEATADRVMRRLHETLEFADVYRQFYVSNPEIRQFEIQLVAGNMISQSPLVTEPKERKITPEALERAYLALANYHFMMSAATITYDGDKNAFEQEFRNVWELYYKPLSSPTNWPILTSEQLDERFTARFNQLAAFFRKYVDSKNFDTPRYRARCNAVRESKSPEPVTGLRKLFEHVGLPPKAPIYTVRRERFYLYFIEEAGELRMLSFSSRIMD